MFKLISTSLAIIGASTLIGLYGFSADRKTRGKCNLLMLGGWLSGIVYAASGSTTSKKASSSCTLDSQDSSYNSDNSMKGGEQTMYPLVRRSRVEIVEPDFYPTNSYSPTILTHETPETAVARGSPQEASKLLVRLKELEEDTKVSQSMVRLLESSPDKTRVTRVKRELRAGIFGIESLRTTYVEEIYKD